MKFNSMIVAACASAFFILSPGVAAPDQTVAEPTAAQVQVQDSSWTGKVEKKEMNGKLNHVLTVGGQSYLLMPQEKAAEFEGKTVVVEGKLEGSTITISKIKDE